MAPSLGRESPRSPHHRAGRAFEGNPLVSRFVLTPSPEITSSAWVNQSRGLAVPFHWQSGYAAFSVSQSNVEAVRDYIPRQPEHHAKQSFQDELREWLRRFEIEWDERYVWD